MDQIRLERDQQGLKISVFNQEYLFLTEILLGEHTLIEEIILNEARLGGSPTIFGTLHTHKQKQILTHLLLSDGVAPARVLPPPSFKGRKISF